MSKNSSITSFFKPVAKQSETPKHRGSTLQTSPTPPPPSPSPLPALFSSSPPGPGSAVRDRNAVIRGSDDEDEDFDSDDDELPPLFPLPSLSTAPIQAPRKELGLYATPKAKRRALEFHSSPLTINTKHKFDIKALLKHAEAETAIEESEKRTAALLDPPSSTPHSAVSPKNAQTTLRDAILGVLSDPEDSQDEGNRDRLLRAVKRTEATVRRKEWYFFDRKGPANSTAIEVRHAFPQAAATGTWAFLAAESHRSEFFEDGVPYHVQCKTLNLPDEIFVWVLNETPHAKSKKLHDEYLRLLGACPSQAERLIDEDAIVQLFRDLGASERALTASTQPSGDSGQYAPYPEHCWPRLRTVLRILTETAPALKIQPLTRALAILLRLGIDNIVREDQAIATHYQDALLQIVLAVPWRAWDSFVRITSLSLPRSSRLTTVTPLISAEP